MIAEKTKNEKEFNWLFAKTEIKNWRNFYVQIHFWPFHFAFYSGRFVDTELLVGELEVVSEYLEFVATLYSKDIFINIIKEIKLSINLWVI